MNNSCVAMYVPYLDPSFGSGGIVSPPFENIPDSSLVYTVGTLSKEQLLLFCVGGVVIKLDESGNPDQTFGDRGFVRVPASRVGSFTPDWLSVFEDDSWLVTGIQNMEEICFARQLSDGSPDPSFGIESDGQVKINIFDYIDRNAYPDARFFTGCSTNDSEGGGVNFSGGGGSISCNNDGKILISFTVKLGAENFKTLLICMKKDGFLDEGFAGNGLMLVEPQGFSYNFGQGATFQKDGKILAFIESGDSVHVVRYHADGRLDFDYGGKQTGVASIKGPGSFANAIKLVLKSDGGVVGFGQGMSNAPHLLIFSLDCDGIPDPAFNNGQPLYPEFPGYLISTARGLSILDDGRIVVGAQVRGGEDYVNLIARFQRDGALDKTFGATGYVVLDGLPTSSTYSSLATMKDGRVVYVCTNMGVPSKLVRFLR
ncbi:hypothetical protein PS865_00354 [Pseudomonas fluorescens]|uniref:delta-60 repeat domain-containing protein n=1 Tax=Pseudomonas fluorescens TaxID=294 RepID=UPI00123EE980|nr:delta-60 repeat domain-containing protein [Pseudomonas fluorescens]VVO52407.1 hypothetical protein PS865_00354 [Pseudomonas fluorescens]